MGNLSNWTSLSALASASACIRADNTFGPTTKELCRGGFDFTLLFEQSFLSLVPSILLILALPFRLVRLLHTDIKTVPSYLYKCKLVSCPAIDCPSKSADVKKTTAVIYGCLQVTLLILWSQETTFSTEISVTSAAFNLINVAAICSLSYYEHTRSVRPSSVLTIYLFFSLLFDAVQARTLWLRDDEHKLASVFIASIVLKLSILLFESHSKFAILKQPELWKSPEATSSIFSLCTFWWLNPLFITGFRENLTLDHLFNLEDELDSERLSEKTIQAWDHSKG